MPDVRSIVMSHEPAPVGVPSRRIFRPGEHGGYVEHVYKGGPPPPRIRRMQLAHEARARRAGVLWEVVDLREVYAHHKGLCGICLEPVAIDEFTVDHRTPFALGGNHLFENLQPAHRSCNVKKGAKLPGARGRRRKFDGIISVRLPQQLHEALVLASIRRKMDLSDVVRECLESIFVSQK